MYLSARKEQFNLAYVCALAAQGGMNHSVLAVDDDSVDIMLHGRGYAGKLRNPQIHLQLKCTAVNMVRGKFIKYALSKKNYDDLRGENVLCPKYLVVLRVPKPPQNWLKHHARHISLHNTCYWTSIRHAPETKNTTSVTVKVPLAQRLTTTALLKLMDLASNGEAA